MDDTAEHFFGSVDLDQKLPLFKVTLAPRKITYYRKKQGYNQSDWTVIAIADLDTERFTIYPKTPELQEDDDAYSKIKKFSFEIDSYDFRELSRLPYLSSNEYPECLPKDIMPRGLGRYFAYGLKIPRRYSTLVEAIESETECNEIFLSHESGIEVDEHILRISRSSFENHCKTLDRQQEMVGRVAHRFKDRASRNFIREAQGKAELDFPKFRTPATNTAAQAFKDTHVTDDDFDEISEMFVRHFPRESRKYTKKILKFHEELMIKSLKSVIAEAETLLEEGASEGKWQTYFDDYRLVLQQLFHAPIEVLRREATIRPQGFTRAGERVTDFLSVNSITRNIVLIEVKKPTAKLMQPSPYRGTSGAEVYGIHSNLAGAIAQLQGQMLSARVHFPSLPADRNSPNVVEYEGAVLGALIIGKMSDLDELQRNSFTLFRETMHNVEIITYDELIERLKNLQYFLEDLQDSSEQISELEGEQ